MEIVEHCRVLDQSFKEQLSISKAWIIVIEALCHSIARLRAPKSKVCGLEIHLQLSHFRQTVGQTDRHTHTRTDRQTDRHHTSNLCLYHHPKTKTTKSPEVKYSLEPLYHPAGRGHDQPMHQSCIYSKERILYRQIPEI
jgi:hypothetical protein